MSAPPHMPSYPVIFNATPVRSTAISLLELPVEILMYIFMYLTPLDIISLRVCNKTLNPITYLKSVWTELFRETCFLYKVFAPTFPTENMSASDLEHAALAPFRFASNLGCGPNPPSRRALQPVRDTSLHPRDPQTLHTFQISAAYLVPGGRFLLLNSTIGTLSLYDLGYSVAHTPSDFPVTSVIWRFRVSAFSAQPTADGQGVRLCVVFHDDANTEVAIFEMFPAKLETNLIVEHSFPLMVAFAFRNDLFAFDHGSYVGVYNFTTGMQTTWRVPGVTTPPRIFLSEDSVLRIHGEWGLDKISMWPIPPLGIDAENLDYLDGRFHLDLPVPCGIACSQSDWYWSNGDNSLHVDCLGLWSNEFEICRYILKRVDTEGDSGIHSTTLELGLRYMPRGFNAGQIQPFPSTRLWDGSTLMLWAEDNVVVANVAKVPLCCPACGSFTDRLPRKTDSSTSTTLYLMDERPSEGEITYCPMSGRVCIATSHGIRVLEYVSRRDTDADVQ